jgi:hypothetical protein
VIAFGELSILKVTIPRATRTQRPVYVGRNPLTGTFQRRYGATLFGGEASQGSSEQMAVSPEEWARPMELARPIRECKKVSARRQVDAMPSVRIW